MSKAKVLGRKTIETDPEYGDYCDVRTRIDANARDRRHMLRNKQWLIKDLMDRSIISEHGCSCSHCQNGWDCCGRMFASSTRIVPAKGGVEVVQSFSRNI